MQRSVPLAGALHAHARVPRTYHKKKVDVYLVPLRTCRACAGRPPCARPGSPSVLYNRSICIIYLYELVKHTQVSALHAHAQVSLLRVAHQVVHHVARDVDAAKAGRWAGAVNTRLGQRLESGPPWGGRHGPVTDSFLESSVTV